MPKIFTSFRFLSGATLLVFVLCSRSIAGDLSKDPAAGPLPEPNSKSLPVADAAKVLPEFEGRYRVGHTTCTVKSIKMAFEVKWAQRRRAVRFFFDHTSPAGEPVFVSEDSGKGIDRFIFHDDRYHSGRFIRADGREFVVERLHSRGRGRPARGR